MSKPMKVLKAPKPEKEILRTGVTTTRSTTSVLPSAPATYRPEAEQPKPMTTATITQPGQTAFPKQNTTKI